MFLDCSDKTRESKEAQAREHLASLEDLRVRSAAELRDFGRELTALGEELEKSREATRSHEGKACRLQVSWPQTSDGVWGGTSGQQTVVPLRSEGKRVEMMVRRLPHRPREPSQQGIKG